MQNLCRHCNREREKSERDQFLGKIKFGLQGNWRCRSEVLEKSQRPELFQDHVCIAYALWLYKVSKENGVGEADTPRLNLEEITTTLIWGCRYQKGKQKTVKNGRKIRIKCF